MSVTLTNGWASAIYDVNTGTSSSIKTSHYDTITGLTEVIPLSNMVDSPTHYFICPFSWMLNGVEMKDFIWNFSSLVWLEKVLNITNKGTWTLNYGYTVGTAIHDITSAANAAANLGDVNYNGSFGAGSETLSGVSFSDSSAIAVPLKAGNVQHHNMRKWMFTPVQSGDSWSKIAVKTDYSNRLVVYFTASTYSTSALIYEQIFDIDLTAMRLRVTRRSSSTQNQYFYGIPAAADSTSAITQTQTPFSFAPEATGSGNYVQWVFNINRPPTAPTVTGHSGNAASPSWFVLAAGATGSQTINWTHNDPDGNGQGAFKYELYRRAIGTAQGAETLWMSQTITSTIQSWTYAGYEPGYIYSYRIATADASDPTVFGAWSAYRYFAYDTKPNAPQNITVEGKSTASSSPSTPVVINNQKPTFAFVFSDNDNGDTLANFWMELQTADGATSLYAGMVNGGVNTYTYTTAFLARSTVFRFRITAYDNHGMTGVVSEWQYFVVNGLPTATNTFGGNTSSSATLTNRRPTLTFSYSDPDGHALKSFDYKIYSNVGTQVASGTVSTGSPQFTVADGVLTNGTSYYYQVQPTDANDGVGSWSTATWFMVNKVPSYPILIAPDDGLRTTATPTFVFKPGDDFENDNQAFEIQFAATSNFATVLFDMLTTQTGLLEAFDGTQWAAIPSGVTTPANETKYVRFTPTARFPENTAYYWRVRGIDQTTGDPGAWSASRQIKITNYLQFKLTIPIQTTALAQRLIVTAPNLKMAYDRTYQNTRHDDPLVTKSGTWATASLGLSADQRTFAYSTTQGSTLTYKFTSDYVLIYGQKGRTYGMADVYIDGQFIQRIDTYQDLTSTTATLFYKEGLDPNVEHTLQIVVAGKGNVFATNVFIFVEYIQTKRKAATLKIEACNNGYDVAPVWEDVTAAFKAGAYYTFQNATKTDSWNGLDIRFTIEANGSTGAVSVDGFGVSFD